MKPLNVVTFGNPYFFHDASCCDINTFAIRIEPHKADMSLPLGIYDAGFLLSSVKENGFKPDLIFVGDESYPPLLFNLEELDIPIIFYAVDTHIQPWHVGYSASVDLLLLAQKKYMQLFPYHVAGENKFFVPLFAPSDIPPCFANSRRDPNAIFVGNLDSKLHPARHAFFSELTKICNVQIYKGPYLEFFSKAGIVLNHSSHDEINFRVFETMYAGAMLITDYVPGLEDLFVSGRDLACFKPGDANHAAEVINHYLNNEDERAGIAWEGQRKVLGHHLRRNRMLDISKELPSIPLLEIRNKRLNNLSVVKEKVSQAYTLWSQFELISPQLRDVYSALAQGEIKYKSVVFER